MTVRSNTLSELLQAQLKSMLTSGQDMQERYALKAVKDLQITGLNDEVAALLDSDMTDPESLVAMAEILSRQFDSYSDSLHIMLKHDGIPPAAKMHILSAMARSKDHASRSAFLETVESLTADQKLALAHRMAETKQSTLTLIDLMDAGLINNDILDEDLLNKLIRHDRKHDRLQAWKKDLEDQKTATARAMKDDVAALKALLAENKGSAERGQALFKSLCLTCHAVGEEGAGFAPALDGSGHRDLDAMLTAIIYPDAAIEGNYSLYRVFAEDGSRTEGFLEQETDEQITLRFMGGVSMDIPQVRAMNAGHVAGRSMMPTGLIDNLSNNQKADLIAYIRSLK